MLKIFALFAICAQAIERCDTNSGVIEVRESVTVSKSEAFCQKFCSKYPGDAFRGACGVVNGKAACYHHAALNGDEESKAYFCNAKDCKECLEYINEGGQCECGLDCYVHTQDDPLNLFQKYRICSKYAA